MGQNHSPGGPKVKVTSHRAFKDLDRDCAPAHNTCDSKILAGPVNGLHLLFVFVTRTEGLSLVPDFHTQI